MKIIIQENQEPEKEAELFVIGACLCLQIGKKMIRVALTDSQWRLLARSATERSAA